MSLDSDRGVRLYWMAESISGVRRHEKVCRLLGVAFSRTTNKNNVCVFELVTCGRMLRNRLKRLSTRKTDAFLPGHIFRNLTCVSAVTTLIFSFLTLFEWKNIIYFTLEINYFSENRSKPSCSVLCFAILCL